jgi:DNA-binding HxlR family transcriptional regulator
MPLAGRHPYCQKPLRHEYRLTDKGWAFYPVIYALRAWGETWCKDPNEVGHAFCASRLWP